MQRAIASGTVVTGILAALTAALGAQGSGYFENPFNHKNDGTHQFPAADWTGPMNQRFHALHMALIPKGTYAGRILAWAYSNPDPQTLLSPGYTWWSIINPAASDNDPEKFMNFKLTHPQIGGRNFDLACAGHAWMADGKLFVAGGTEKYSSDASRNIVGAKAAYIFDPSATPVGNAMWQKITSDLEAKRWYPTVTQNENDWMIVTGGHILENPPGTADDYEAWNTQANPPGWHLKTQPTTQIWLGPSQVNNQLDPLWAYPRFHMIPNGEMVMAGMFPKSVVLRHVPNLSGYGPEVWIPRGVSLTYREYGTSILYPNLDADYANSVLILGGRILTQVGPPPVYQYFDSVQLSKAGASSAGCFPDGYYWTTQVCDDAMPSMNYARVFLNAVLAPDASVYVFGGENSSGAVKAVERFSGSVWTDLGISCASTRDYHSTTMLLSDGRMMLAGGESRSYDYEVYVPDELASGIERPVIVNTSATMNYGTQPFTVNYDYGGVGATVTKVVLLRAGSVTHHHDMDQRYVELRSRARRAARSRSRRRRLGLGRAPGRTRGMRPPASTCSSWS